jgi:hypothetical protein
MIRGALKKRKALSTYPTNSDSLAINRPRRGTAGGYQLKTTSRSREDLTPEQLQLNDIGYLHAGIQRLEGGLYIGEDFLSAGDTETLKTYTKLKSDQFF